MTYFEEVWGPFLEELKAREKHTPVSGAASPGMPPVQRDVHQSPASERDDIIDHHVQAMLETYGDSDMDSNDTNNLARVDFDKEAETALKSGWATWPRRPYDLSRPISYSFPPNAAPRCGPRTSSRQGRDEQSGTD